MIDIGKTLQRMIFLLHAIKNDQRYGMFNDGQTTLDQRRGIEDSDDLVVALGQAEKGIVLICLFLKRFRGVTLSENDLEEFKCMLDGQVMSLRNRISDSKSLLWRQKRLLKKMDDAESSVWGFGIARLGFYYDQLEFVVSYKEKGEEEPEMVEAEFPEV